MVESVLRSQGYLPPRFNLVQLGVDAGEFLPIAREEIGTAAALRHEAERLDVECAYVVVVGEVLAQGDDALSVVVVARRIARPQRRKGAQLFGARRVG
jgi:hypothetical protein